MAFLNPGALWLLAGVLPAILILYFLKLRRQEQVVSSTLLWRRSVHDLRVNAPFQRLRRNLLLLLQLLFATLLILALARPYGSLRQAGGRQAALIIDVSASMATRDVDGRTRLEAAREEALALIENLPTATWRGGEADRLCVIAAADRPLLLSGLTADKQTLRNAVRSIGLRSTTTDMAAALEMAIAVTGVARTVREMEAGGEIESAERPSAQPETYEGVLGDSVKTATDVLLLSDGAFPPIASRISERLSGPPVEGASGGSRYIRIGSPGTENTAIVSLSAREDPAAVGGRQLFARIESTAGEEREVTVTLEIEGAFVDEKTLTIPARSGSSADAVGSRGVIFELPEEALGRVHLRIEPGDAFPVDDEAFAVLEPPEPISVLLVTEGNFFLETALRVNGNTLEYEILPPEDWPGEAPPARADGEPWELIVFDRFAPPLTPEGASFFIDAVPGLPGLRVREEGQLFFPAIYDWKRLHPTLRHLSLLERISIRSCRNLAFEGAWAELVFAEGLYAEDPDALEGEDDWLQLPAREVTLLGALLSEKRRAAVLAFDILQTRDWVLRPGFPLFIRNVIHWLARPGGLHRAAVQRTGTTLRLSFPEPVTDVTVTTPSGASSRPPMASPRSAYFSDTHQPGFYRVRANGRPERLFAFSLLSGAESRIAARESVRLGETTLAGEADGERENRELWPFLILAALGLLFLEWYVYNIRILG